MRAGHVMVARMFAAVGLLAWSLAASPVQAFTLPNDCRQVILGLADSWDSSRGTVQWFERSGAGWKSVGGPVATRLGRDGLVWGRGLHPVPEGARLKRERDWRAPAGVFALGGVYGYAPDCVRRSGVPYRQVTARDLWIDDPASGRYNEHALLDHDAPRNEWERKMQMKQGDYPHSLKLFIAHNPGPGAVPGAGSAIFFHIWRDDGGKPSSGCTTMTESALREIIAWMDPARRPLYVLLPRAEYVRLKAEWRLP